MVWLLSSGCRSSPVDFRLLSDRQAARLPHRRPPCRRPIDTERISKSNTYTPVTMSCRRHVQIKQDKHAYLGSVAHIAVSCSRHLFVRLSLSVSKMSKHHSINPLQLSEDLVSARNGDLARVALVLSVGDLAVVEDHSPATAIKKSVLSPQPDIMPTYFLSPIPAAQP